MTYPFDKLTIEQRLQIFPTYWKYYVNDLVHIIQDAFDHQPLTFSQWWEQLPGLHFNFWS